MKLDWRAGAVAAGAAFFLSLVAGVFAGVAFGALVLRAVMGGVVFGGGAVAASYVIDRYLPDLKQSLAKPGSAEDEAPGGRVDIVVDDESDGLGLGSNGFEMDEADEPAPGEPSDDDMGSPSTDLDGEDVEELETAELETVDETDEPAGPAAREFTPGIAAERVHGGAGDGVGEPEELPEAEEADAPEAASAGRLPDIGGFSGSFSEAPANGFEDEPSGQSGEDPSVLARAIRTVLKREE